jgi:hypothetical protein
MRISNKTYNYIFKQIIDRAIGGKKNHDFLAAFCNSNFGYRKILKKAGLFEKGKPLEIFQLGKGIRKTITLPAFKCLSMYGSAGNYFGGFTDFGIREIKKDAETLSDKYSIFLNKRNDIFVKVSFENSCKTSELPLNCVERELSFLNLPLFFHSLINEPAFSEQKVEVEKLLEKNLTSTLANVFNYVKGNSEEIAKIPQLVSAINEKIQENSGIYYSDSFNNILDGKKIGKFRVERNMYVPLVRIPYYIYMEKEEISLQLNFDVRKYDSISLGSAKDFPVLVTLKEGKIIPVFLFEEAFEKIKNSYQLGIIVSPNEKGAVSLLGKIQEILLREEIKEKGIRQWLSKFSLIGRGRRYKIRRNLEKNVERVVEQLVKYLKETFEIDDNYQKQLEDIQKIKVNVSEIEIKTQELINILSRIYKKEILLNVL